MVHIVAVTLRAQPVERAYTQQLVVGHEDLAVHFMDDAHLDTASPERGDRIPELSDALRITFRLGALDVGIEA